jgi:hypothetical protein
MSDVTAPSLLILGTDTVLTSPATAVQLAHACLAAGYEAVIPATWGDELIAAHALRRVQRSNEPLVLCACPLVSQRLGDEGSALGAMLLSTASPPVATALYLRALYAPNPIRVTYAGGCAGAADKSIDVRMSAEELLAELVSREIDVSTQPTEFDSVLPPDRRRFFSEPGGMPSSSALRDATRTIALLELGPDDFVIALAQRLLERSQALIDIAPALGCVCSGAAATRNPQVARARVRAVEPPRATSPILDHAITIEIEPSTSPPFVPVSAPAPPLPEPTESEPTTEVEPGEAILTVAATALRRSTSATSRTVLGVMPQARTEPGRQLPRAYVARRRSTPRSVRALGARNSGPIPANLTRGWRLWLVIGLLVIASGIGALSVYASR